MRRRDLLAAAAGAIVATTLAGGIAWAAIPGPGGVIQGCYKQNNGQLRVVDVAGDCLPSELALNWNQQGIQGPSGPSGPPGPTGTALAYAHGLADGTINQDSGNISVFRGGPGAYCVGVTGGPVHAPVVSLDSASNVGGSAQAGVFWASGCPEAQNDVLVITRPHDQDGGVPGADRAFYIIVN
jgi:hypothetical protein